MLVDGVSYHGVQFEDPSSKTNGPASTSPHTVIPPFDDPDDPNDDVNGVPIPIPPLPTIATQSAQDAYDSVLAGAGRAWCAMQSICGSSIRWRPAWPRQGRAAMELSPTSARSAVIPSFRSSSVGRTMTPIRTACPTIGNRDHGLNSANAADRNGDFDTDGYTNLEEFLDELGAFQAVEDVVWDGGNGRYALIDNWNIAFQPSRFDTAVINSGTATVDAVGQHAGTLKIGIERRATRHFRRLARSSRMRSQIGLRQTRPLRTLNLSGRQACRRRSCPKARRPHSTSPAARCMPTWSIFDLVNNGGTIAPGYESPARRS